jgi:hypothetical protein
MGCRVDIVLLANDAVATNALRFLHSVSMFAKGANVSYIAFDEQTEFCERLFPAFGVKRLDADFDEIKQLQSLVYDPDPPQQPWPLMAGKLRKLRIIDEAKPVMYFDTDCVLTNSIDPVVAAAAVSEVKLLYCSKSRDWVYEEGSRGELREKSHLFSTGFLIYNHGFPSSKDIISTVVNNLEEFRFVVKKGVVDQPLINFAVDKLNIKTSSLQELCGYSDASTVGSQFVVRDDWTVYRDGMPVLFLHQAGSYRQDQRYAYLFDAHLLGALSTLRAYLPAAEFMRLAPGIIPKAGQ